MRARFHGSELRSYQRHFWAHRRAREGRSLTAGSFAAVRDGSLRPPQVGYRRAPIWVIPPMYLRQAARTLASQRKGVGRGIWSLRLPGSRRRLKMGISNRITSILASGAIVAAVALPAAAQARPNANAISGTPAVVVQTPAPAESGQAGFQWGDAGIGAAAAVLLVGAGAAAGLSTRRRRVRTSAMG